MSLTTRDSRIENLIEWLEMRRQTIDGIDVVADIRDLMDEVRKLREERKQWQNAKSGS